MKFIEGNLYFNKLIVVQSIPDDEPQTGTDLYNDYIKRLAWLDKNLHTDIVDVNTRQEFFEILNKIKEDIRREDILPYIHLETHGTKEGISLKSGDTVRFKDFIQTLREINILSKNNLFISVSACWGGRIQMETDIEQPCPFRGFIGPMQKIFPRDLIVSFSEFFDEFLRSKDFEKAVNKLNTYNKSGVIFSHYNAESFYDLLIEHYNKSQKGLALREKIVKDLTNQKWANDPNLKQYLTKARLAKEFERLVKNQTPTAYKRIRDNFLHINMKMTPNQKNNNGL